MREPSPPTWVRNAVFYQIFPDRFRNGDPENDPPGTRPWGERPTPLSFFGGDLRGILERVDYLEDLGVTALYLTPIFTASTNHKYDGEDYYQVDPVLGGNDAFRRLVAALHARGMRIILDGVFNHCGSGHPFFRDAVERGRGSRYWSWFRIRGDGPRADPEPNYACWAGCASLPEWNHGNPEVRNYLLEVVRHWIAEYGIDGWRLDTVEYLAPDFAREIYRITKAVNPEAYVLGEVMGLATSWFRHGALDGVMHYKLWEGLVRFLAEGSWDAPRFARYVQGIWASYPREASFACYTLLGSHDKPRFLTLCRGDKRKLVLAAAFLFAFPGAPAVYYGDEIRMEGGEDPDCRRTFPWDTANWDLPLRETFKAFVRTRQAEPALRQGDVRWVAAQGRGLMLSRGLPDDLVCLALNAGEMDERMPLPASGVWTDLLTGDRAHGSLIVPPMGFQYLRRGTKAG